MVRPIRTVLMVAALAIAGGSPPAAGQLLPPGMLSPFLKPPAPRTVPGRLVPEPFEAMRTTVPTPGAMVPPVGAGEGPQGSLTLERAIARLLEVNHDLRARYQEIPKARADVLTAGLIGNPLVFGAAAEIPYGRYSPQRPGSDDYVMTVIQPVELGGQRKRRVMTKQWELRVAEAEYQDDVRLKIDELGQVFVDALSARVAVRAAGAGLEELDGLILRVGGERRGGRPGSGGGRAGPDRAGPGRHRMAAGRVGRPAGDGVAGRAAGDRAGAAGPIVPQGTLADRAPRRRRRTN